MSIAECGIQVMDMTVLPMSHISTSPQLHPARHAAGAWNWLARALQCAFASFVHSGTLRVTTSGGEVFTVGDGSGKPVAIRFTSLATEVGVLLDPDVRFGEAYMDGSLAVEEGSIADVLALAFSQDRSGNPMRWAKPQWVVRYLCRRLGQFNSRNRAQRNVAHHYDLDERLYSMFLDADRQYSCAYFEKGDRLLDSAQLAKKRHLAAKLLIGPGTHVLDIGCGWGGLFCSGGQAENLHILCVLALGDEFRERIAFCGSQEKIGKCLSQGVCNDKLRWRDAGTNGSQPGPE